jgi:hypothetical protein
VQRGGADRVSTPHADMSDPPGATGWFRIRRARLLFQVADVAPFLSTRARKSRQHLPACGPPSYSYPPDTICPNRIGRLRRCPNSDISYKLMLHLKMLKKSAIKKNFASIGSEGLKIKASWKMSLVLRTKNNQQRIFNFLMPT